MKADVVATTLLLTNPILQARLRKMVPWSAITALVLAVLAICVSGGLASAASRVGWEEKDLPPQEQVPRKDAPPPKQPPGTDRSHPVSLTGVWELRLAIYRKMESDGAPYESAVNETLFVELEQHEGELTGTIVGGTGPLCKKGVIRGTVTGSVVAWNLLYTGSCCLNGVGIFQGKVEPESKSTSMTGRMKPKEAPSAGSCWLAWARFTGTKRL